MLDLVGSLADLKYLRVAVEAGDVTVQHVAGPAEDLHRLADHGRGDPARLQLGHGGLLPERLARVAQRGGAVGEPPGGLDLRRHVGELELNRLETGDRAAELLAALRVGQGHPQRAGGGAERERRDRDPPDFQGAEELGESAARLAYHLAVGNPDAAEKQVPGFQALPADTAQLRPERVARCPLLDDEAAEARLARGVLAGTGEQRDAEAHVGARVRDEGLLPGQHPPGGHPYGPGPQGADVRACPRLRESESAELAAFREGPQPLFALVVVTEEQQREAAD